jgi:hypothetical protein
MQFRLDFPDGEDEPFVVEVKFQAPLAEARQQAIAFATILSKLAPADAAAKPAAVPTPANVTPLDRINARGLKKA